MSTTNARKNDAMPSLPLGAVRTDDGEVVIPSSRRADGSMRKQIRVRQGYVPQDEVPKYKPIGQRLREQAKRDQKQHHGDSRGEQEAEAIASQLQSLQLGSSSSAKKTKETETPLPERTASASTQDQSRVRHKSFDRAASGSSDTRELKNELSSVNRLLRDIAKLEDIAAAVARQEEGARPLSQQQERKLQRKQELTTRRDEIIALLPPRETTQSPRKQRSPPAAAAAANDSEAKPRTLRTIEL